MMMWGKWRIYSRTEYDSGKAKPPIRVKWKKDLNNNKLANVSNKIENVAVLLHTDLITNVQNDPELYSP